MTEFYTAQVCLSGHCIDSCYEYPDRNSLYYKKGETETKFCDKCGEALITQCPECKTPIRGDIPLTHIIDYFPPNYCHSCGKPFPWLDKKIKAAIEMAELEEVLTSEEIVQLTEYAQDITTDTPSAQVSAKRITILFRKFASSSLPAIRALFVDIASDTAKKMLTDGRL
ncbi:MAG: DUF2321 domain-containing protein [Legionella sp.]|uniref:DUF2321 domain-containing protein n=1 Tax=Legionella sp. TaxID=459 RepID=UPI002845ADF0|nr:DUF2321 domain-containing protein [Legionella sp.]